MIEKKVYSMLGLAQKAGKLVSGEEGCEEKIKRKKAKILIIATDSSENTKRKFFNMCRFYKIDCIEFGEKVKLGSCIGNNSRAVICIMDNNFKKAVMQILNGGE